MTEAEKFERNRRILEKALEKSLRQQSETGYYGKGLLEWGMKDGVVQRPIKTTQSRDDLHTD